MDTPPKPILPTKQEKKRRKRDVHVKPNKKVRLSTFKKRYATLKRKAEELETLCDTPVSMVCYGPDGQYYTLPEDGEKTKDIIRKFRKDSDCEEYIVENVELLGFLENKKKKFEGKKSKATVKDIDKLFESWNEKFPKLCEKSMENFHDFLENKIQVFTERLRLLKEEEEEKEKGKAIQLCDDEESGLNYVNHQSYNSLLSLGSSTYNQMDVGSSSNSGTTSLLGVSNSNPSFGIPEIFDLMSDNNNNIVTSEINNNVLLGNDFLSEFAQTDLGFNTSFGMPKNSDLMNPLEFGQRNMGFNTSFGIPQNFNMGYNNNSIPTEFAQTNMGVNPGFGIPAMGYYNNSIPMAETNRDFRDFPLEIAQTNMGLNNGLVIPENINMTRYNCNILPNSDIPLEYAQTTTSIGTMKNSEASQLSPLLYTLPRSMKQSTDGNKSNGCNKFNPSHGRI